ncbi:MAG: dipicolinate synthase subunit B [Oscillospiraceae bacterium]|jgi:dipicolinate synthase subunit B|nr:dipicolinate synthase subunit B [Oscillospiraceae bacterium]
MENKKIRVGFVICGSFCTIAKAIESIEALQNAGYEVLPIMSDTAYATDTRFGAAADIIAKIENLTQKKIIHTIEAAEPIGPKKLCDILIIAPCTGNTLGKLAGGITDTAATMATKSHLRGGNPVLIALATNDGLGASAQNIAALKNTKHIFFVPIRQDDCIEKPNSLVADFDLLIPSIEDALQGKQSQPFFVV